MDAILESMALTILELDRFLLWCVRSAAAVVPNSVEDNSEQHELVLAVRPDTEEHESLRCGGLDTQVVLLLEAVVVLVVVLLPCIFLLPLRVLLLVVVFGFDAFAVVKVGSILSLLMQSSSSDDLRLLNNDSLRLFMKDSMMDFPFLLGVFDK